MEVISWKSCVLVSWFIQQAVLSLWQVLSITFQMMLHFIFILLSLVHIFLSEKNTNITKRNPTIWPTFILLFKKKKNSEISPSALKPKDSYIYWRYQLVHVCNKYHDLNQGWEKSEKRKEHPFLELYKNCKILGSYFPCVDISFGKTHFTCN